VGDEQLPQGIDEETYNLLRDHTYQTQGEWINFDYEGRKGKKKGLPVHFEDAIEKMGAAEDGSRVIMDDADKVVVTVQDGNVYIPPKFALSAYFVIDSKMLLNIPAPSGYLCITSG